MDAIARQKAIDSSRIEIWFSDEARIGQKNKITRRWAKRGTRPSAPRDQRTASTYIFGAVCPKDGKGAALILPALVGLLVPPNITIIALPPKCPELNPVENIWQFMRDNWLSNRVFKSYDDLVEHCCEA